MVREVNKEKMEIKGKKGKKAIKLVVALLIVILMVTVIVLGIMYKMNKDEEYRIEKQRLADLEVNKTKLLTEVLEIQKNIETKIFSGIYISELPNIKAEIDTLYKSYLEKYENLKSLITKEAKYNDKVVFETTTFYSFEKIYNFHIYWIKKYNKLINQYNDWAKLNSKEELPLYELTVDYSDFNNDGVFATKDDLEGKLKD